MLTVLTLQGVNSVLTGLGLGLL